MAIFIFSAEVHRPTQSLGTFGPQLAGIGLVQIELFAGTWLLEYNGLGTELREDLLRVLQDPHHFLLVECKSLILHGLGKVDDVVRKSLQDFQQTTLDQVDAGPTLASKLLTSPDDDATVLLMRHLVALEEELASMVRKYGLTARAIELLARSPLRRH